MPTKEQILKRLPPYQNKATIVVEEQTTNDIVNGILKTHNQYANDYDAIVDLFEADTIKATCKNVFNFLKQNVPYKIESGNKQKLCSPAAILFQDAGIDCKNIALFSNGIADALRRKYSLNFGVIYRFAGYNKKQIEHVFSVVSNDTNEIWNDAVLNTFNERLQPIFYKDKIVKPMALVAINGIPQPTVRQIKTLAYKNNVPAFTYAGKIAPQSIGDAQSEAEFWQKVNQTFQQLIAFFKDWNISDGEKMKRAFVEQNFTPNQMLLWYIKNKKDDWAYLHQAKEILIYDTPNINYNVADAFNTLIDKPEWKQINVQYDVPFNLSQTNKTPFFLLPEFRGKNYVATPSSGGGETPSGGETPAKSNLLKIAAGLLLIKQFI
jgi:hypothetical protein